MKPDEAPSLPGWMTATEISEFLGVSRQTVNQMIHAGDFHSLHKKGSEKKPVFYAKVEEVEAMKESRTFPRSTPTDAA